MDTFVALLLVAVPIGAVLMFIAAAIINFLPGGREGMKDALKNKGE